MVIIESIGNETRDWRLSLASLVRWLLLVGAIYLPWPWFMWCGAVFMVISGELNEYLQEAYLDSKTPIRKSR